MATLQQYYDYSTLSLAAYAEGLVVGGNINEGSFIEADFTDKQFDEFIASGWEVVDQSSPRRAYLLAVRRMNTILPTTNLS